MSHRDAIHQAVVEVERCEGIDPQVKARVIKALREAAKFLHKNQANLRDNFARAAISGSASAIRADQVWAVAQGAYAIADDLMLARMKGRQRESAEVEE